MHHSNSPNFAIEQARDAAHGGAGWAPRAAATAQELGTIWGDFGVRSECGRLRAVLMRRPGPEIDGVTDAASALWYDLLEPELARAQHDALAKVYRDHGVAVCTVEETAPDMPNAYFCRDQFAMTPVGAILARPASRSRAGEERYVAQALAALGVPILLSVHGEATFEGADIAVVNDDLVFVGEGQRTNPAGAEQVARLFREVGFGQVEIVHLPYGTGHLDGMLNIVDRDLAIVYPTQLPYRAWETLKRHGFRFLDVPDVGEARRGMAINMVPLAPGHVVMPAGNPITRAALEGEGVACVEVDVSELMKGAGSVHCMTGVLKRHPA